LPEQTENVTTLKRNDISVTTTSNHATLVVVEEVEEDERIEGWT
jgi:hypothetical protein